MKLTNCSILLVEIMLHSKLHCQKGFNFILFSYMILAPGTTRARSGRGGARVARAGEDLGSRFGVRGLGFGVWILPSGGIGKEFYLIIGRKNSPSSAVRIIAEKT